MHFDLHMRRAVRDHLAQVSARMAAWEQRAETTPEQQRRLIEAIQPFRHSATQPDLFVGGVDGSGDFPCLAYGDSFVFLTVAAGAAYRSDAVHGLAEVPAADPLVEFTWLPTAAAQRKAALLESFARLSGRDVQDVLTQSDYRVLKGGQADPRVLEDGLIVPQGHDAANIGIQLRTTAELGAALALMEKTPAGGIVLFDGTMSLPFVGRSKQSLFFEHLRRLCCVVARQRGVVFAALSKSSGLPPGLDLEQAASTKLAVREPEHWFLRVPSARADGWSLWSDDAPQVPPHGAVSYLVRFHRRTPVMRLDLDERYWAATVRGGSADETARNEARLFEMLDYAGHDQRSYGYPYPIKAAHDRASLTEAERVAMRSQLIDSAVGAGMRRSDFRDPVVLTGHA